MSRTFVIGDIHGAHRALLQCLQRSQFNYETDRLICLGDVCDGWPETKQSIDTLLTIKNLVYILGNHDFWTLEWMQTGIVDEIWFSQGGEATITSYPSEVPPAHKTFLENAKHYLLLNNKLFVHAGIIPGVPIEKQQVRVMLWDRALVQTALQHVHDLHLNLTGYDEVFVGHTPVSSPPMKACEVWLMDTGAGWSGRLSMMNIETKEVFMSDPVPDLYPGVKGRSRN